MLIKNIYIASCAVDICRGAD